MPKIILLDPTKLRFAPYNARKSYSEASLAELATSIREQGMLQPILIRPVENHYEVVCGSRRTKASILAKVSEIPCLLREMTDQEAIEANLTENLQRSDVHPLEEARAVAGLLESEFYSTYQQVADRLGRTAAWVGRRHKLIALVPEVLASLEANEFPLGWYEVASGLDELDQSELLDSARGFHGPKNAEGARAWITSRGRPLTEAPWSVDDEDTPGGACVRCPFNTIQQPDLFEEAEPKCMKPSCWRANVEAHVERQATNHSLDVQDIDWTTRVLAKDHPPVQGEKSVIAGPSSSWHLANPGEVIRIGPARENSQQKSKPDDGRKEQLAAWKRENAVAYSLQHRIFQVIGEAIAPKCRWWFEKLQTVPIAASWSNPSSRGTDKFRPLEFADAASLVNPSWDLDKISSHNRSNLRPIVESFEGDELYRYLLTVLVWHATHDEVPRRDFFPIGGQPSLDELVAVMELEADLAEITKHVEETGKPKIWGDEEAKVG